MPRENPSSIWPRLELPVSIAWCGISTAGQIRSRSHSRDAQAEVGVEPEALVAPGPTHRVGKVQRRKPDAAEVVRRVKVLSWARASTPFSWLAARAAPTARSRRSAHLSACRLFHYNHRSLMRYPRLIGLGAFGATI